MSSTNQLTRFAVALLIAATGVLVWLYACSESRLTTARQARRDDDCATAEKQLTACWPLPGLHRAIALEDDLLGVQQGDLRNEDPWQARAKTPSSQSVLILEALAKGNLATFQYNEAIAYADAILERQPGDPRALWLRGRALVPLQQEQQAKADFEQALLREPEAFEIRLSLAELLHKLGHVREAITHYERLHHLRATDARVIVALAHCKQEQGEHHEAGELLTALHAKSPGSLPARVEDARLSLRTRQFAEGERAARLALELAPDNAAALRVLQLCLDTQNKTDESINRRRAANERQQAEFRLKLHDSGRDPALLAAFGHWILQTGDQREAAGWFYASLKEDSSHKPAHAGLAQVFTRWGQPRRAEMHARLAGEDALPRQPNVMQQPYNPSLRVQRTGLVDLANGKAPAKEAAVRDLCAACHAYPPPESMPQAVWRKEVKQGYDLLRDSTLALHAPPLESVVAYYEQHAPERLPAIDRQASTAKPPAFEKQGTGWLVNLPPYPGVANVNIARLFGTPNQELLACDTRLDRVLVFKPYEKAQSAEPLPQIIAPSHTAVADLDGDGRLDVLVASLGSFFPTDDKVGKVVWLRQVAHGKFEATTLLDGVGRVADAQPADFNADGKLDLVVAVFGWRTTGEILYLENQTTDWSHPEFARHIVDTRHGAIHVPVVDLNRDDRPDFVALISQEHETVVAYLSQGNGEFRPETIFTASHPTFGASGIELADLDCDGDQDVLLTNGDVLDRPYLLKPYHGVRWLENEGTFPFKHHLLAAMYGASRAVAADFDGDQDLDVAAVSFLPRLEFPERENLRLPSVVLFEQTAKRVFQMHVLESGACDHFTCAAGDWDSDGKIDLAVGNYSWKRSQAYVDAAVLWKNVTGE